MTVQQSAGRQAGAIPQSTPHTPLALILGLSDGNTTVLRQRATILAMHAAPEACWP
jgi:hypothetical protein